MLFVYNCSTNIFILNDNLFIGRKSLESLFLNSSHVVSISNETFKGLSDLVTLHLEHNVLAQLSGGEFLDGKRIDFDLVF